MLTLPIIGVMGSGVGSRTEKAASLGKVLASLDVHLLTGGGRGVMDAVSKAFAETPERKGLVIGIIPGNETGNHPEAYPNPWVEIPIYTHLPLSGTQGEESMSRNHINVLSSAVLIALPGGPGTASEVHLAVKYSKPVIGFIDNPDEISGLKVDIPFSPDLEEILRFVKEHI